jgi:hypothetical protein
LRIRRNFRARSRRHTHSHFRGRRRFRQRGRRVPPERLLSSLENHSAANVATSRRSPCAPLSATATTALHEDPAERRFGARPTCRRRARERNSTEPRRNRSHRR